MTINNDPVEQEFQDLISEAEQARKKAQASEESARLKVARLDRQITALEWAKEHRHNLDGDRNDYAA